MKLTIGNITPLSFIEAASDPSATALSFTQRFGRYDHIVVQFFVDANVVGHVRLYNATTRTVITLYNTLKSNFGNGTWAYTAILPVLNEGVYFITIGTDVSPKRWLSQDFEVTRTVENDQEWALFEYGGTRNDTPLDAMFYTNHIRVPFLVRLPAGFKPQGWDFSAETETYRTQKHELRILYSAPSTKYTLTLGSASGIPIEYVRLLNNILSCEYVYINGERYCRSEGSVPEKQLVMAGAQMFNASVVLEKQPKLDNYPLDVYQNGDEFNNDYNNDYDI